MLDGTTRMDKATRNGRRISIALIIVTMLVATLWFVHRSTVHPQFGRIYTTDMSESYKENQTGWQNAEARVREWLHLRARRPKSPNGWDAGLQIGPALLGWSLGDHIYMNNPLPPSEPRWEFALSNRKRLQEVTYDDLRCEFYGMNDARGTNVFGPAWEGHAIRVQEGQIFFARLLTNRPVIYAIHLAERGGNNSWGTMKARYVAVTNIPPN